jgi:hypothetical protein
MPKRNAFRLKLGVTALLSIALALILAACTRVITHEPGAPRYDSVSEQNATYRSVLAPPERPAYAGSYYASASFAGSPNPTGESRASGNLDVNAPEGYSGYYGAAFFFPAGTFSGSSPAQRGAIDILRWQSVSGDFGGIRIAPDHLGRLIRGNSAAPGPPENVTSSSFGFEEGCWNWVVVHQKLSRTAGQAINEVTLNGRKVASSTNANNYSGQGAEQARFGLPSIDQGAQTVPLEFYVDNAYVGASNDAPPGPRSNSCAGDRTPPKFAGLKSATTCIPGPIGGGRTTSYHLSWDRATDDVTLSSEIVYDVYQATTPGGEDFSVPTYRTPPGATSFDTPQLPTDETFYFVVRARDQAGNRDSNTVERQGVNLCD